MPAAYDKYNYPNYWKGRNYEHESEIIAIKGLLSKLKRINKAIDIGAGFGRLTNAYLYKVDNVVLTDPSAKLLKRARNTYKDKHISFKQSKLELLPEKVKNKDFDLAIIVRVLHHLDDLDRGLVSATKLIKKGGYLILEFPNKRHLKATMQEFLRGNFTFPIDIFPKDLSKDKHNCLPFKNYHPDIVKQKLREKGYTIKEERSVSNIRSPLLKKTFPLKILLVIEKLCQKPLAKIYFGPSIFILAKKGE